MVSIISFCLFAPGVLMKTMFGMKECVCVCSIVSMNFLDFTTLPEPSVHGTFYDEILGDSVLFSQNLKQNTLIIALTVPENG